MKKTILIIAFTLIAAADCLATTFNVKDFGAVGDGVTDDTRSIQAAVDAADAVVGGTVLAPKGFYKLTDTVVISRSSLFRTINLVGEGTLATRFRWYGPATGVAIRVNGLKQYRFDGWVLENMGARGTTTGILVQRDTGTGSQSGNATWRNIRVSGFGTGVRVGNLSISQAASEFLFEHLTLQLNDTGILIEDWNSLNFAFTMLEMTQNGTGLSLSSGGNINVFGGSVGQNTVTDFHLGPGGSHSITGVRSERSNRFLTGGGSSGGSPTTVTSSLVVGASNPDGYCIDIGSGPVVLIGNTLLCKVKVTANSWCSDVAIGNAIFDSVPFSVIGSGGHYAQFGNRRVDGSNHDVGHFSDETGYVSSSARVPLLKEVAR